MKRPTDLGLHYQQVGYVAFLASRVARVRLVARATGLTAGALLLASFELWNGAAKATSIRYVDDGRIAPVR